MKTSQKTTPSEEGKIRLKSLQNAVTETLERKRRLGQYAVIWQNGKPVVTGEDTQNSTKSSV